MGKAYYNEFNLYAAKWLENLIAAGHLPEGDVDTRSIVDVSQDDVKGYTQCHFFAGIGGWTLALRMAGWPDDSPVWTGSCPCQPFSAAGKKKGKDDERHLWPIWYNLIKQCKPVTVFGEQVDAAVKHGWLDDVQNDMEAVGYSTGAVCLPAASVGAPHTRQRLWFVADADIERSQRRLSGRADSEREVERGQARCGCTTGGCMANNNRVRLEGMLEKAKSNPERHHSKGGGQQPSYPAGADVGQEWRDCDRIYCRDGKLRPIKPGIVTVVNGLPGRVGQVCAYGNAIVPQVAAEVIKAFMQIKKDGMFSRNSIEIQMRLFD